MTTTTVEPREPQLVAPPAGLAPALTAALARAGITSLYSHQVEALEAAARSDT